MLQNLCFYSSISYVNHGNFVQKDLQGNVYSKIIIKVFIGYYLIDHLIPSVPLMLAQFPQGVLPSLGPLRNEIEPTSVGHSVGKDT